MVFLRSRRVPGCNEGYQKHEPVLLEGSTMKCVLAIANDSDEDAKLCRMRLGHAGEKCMQALMKQDLLKGAKTRKLKFFEHCVLSKKTKVCYSVYPRNS